MQNKQKTRKILRYIPVLLIAITVAFLIECLIFQFPALRYKEKPITFTADGTDSRVQAEVTDTLVALTEEEVRSIEVERDNLRKLAEYNGEEFVPPEDETLVEKDDWMYRKVKQARICIRLEKPYYIHNMDLRLPLEENAGYSVIVYKDGKVVNDNIYCTIEAKIDAGIANVSEYADYLEITVLSEEAPAVEDMKVTIANSFAPNAMRIMFLILLMMVASMLIMEKDALQNKQENIFAVICLLLGGMMIWGIGTNQVSYDEYVHAKAAYKLSFGTRIEFTESALQMAGNLLPHFNNPKERALIEEYEDKNHDYSWADIGSQSKVVRAETRVYYPMAAGFWIGRKLHLGFADTVALAKLGNLLVYILVVFIAIKCAGRYKNIVAMVGLLPNGVFQAASLTYDTVLNCFLILGAVLMINELLEPDRKLTWQRLLPMLLSFVIGCQSKPVYVLMAFPVLFFSKNKFHNRMQEWICKAAMLAVMGLMIYNIFCPTPSAGSDYHLVSDFAYAGDKRNVGTSVTGQIKYIFSHPFAYAILLLSSMFELVGNYLWGGNGFLQYGYLGSAPMIVTYIVIALGLWLSLFSSKGEKRKSPGSFLVVWILLTLFGVSAVIYTSMYVSYTPVGATEIRGVQGRYFVPLFLPLMICFLNGKWESRVEKMNRSRIMFATMTLINMVMIYGFIIMRMNV